MEKVDFREVCDFVRFTMFGEFETKTLTEFKCMDVEEQSKYVQEVFRLHMDVCEFLSSQLEMDKISTRYQARADERRRKEHETED